MSRLTEHDADPSAADFETGLARALRSNVAVPARDPGLGDHVAGRVRSRRRRRRVTYLGVVFLFVGLLAGLSLGPSLDRADDRGELATQPTTQADSGTTGDDLASDPATASGDKRSAVGGATPSATVGDEGRPPTRWEGAASLLLILGVPATAGALSLLSSGGRAGRRRVGTAVLAALAAQVFVLCATGIVLMYTYQPLPPEIGGASLDSIDQDISPGIVRGVHAVGSIVFPLFLIAGLLVICLTLPSRTKAGGLIAALVVGIGTIAWMAEGLLRTGGIVGWDQLAFDEVSVGTDVRGVLRPLDVDTVAWRDGSVERIVSDGTTYGVDGYRSAFVEHGLLAALAVGVIGAGLLWTRRSMTSTRLTAWVGGWLAGFALFRYGIYVSGVVRARRLVDTIESQRAIDIDTYQCTNVFNGSQYEGRTIAEEVYAAGLGGSIFYLWFIPVILYGGLALVGYGLSAVGTDGFRRKRLIHLVPIILVIFTVIVLASTHALGVTSCVLE